MIYHAQLLTRDPSVKQTSLTRQVQIDYSLYNAVEEFNPGLWEWQGCFNHGRHIPAFQAGPVLKLYERHLDRHGEPVALERWCCPLGDGSYQPYRVRYRTELWRQAYTMPLGLGRISDAGLFGHRHYDIALDAPNALLDVVQQSAGRGLSDTVREIKDELTNFAMTTDRLVPDFHSLTHLTGFQRPMLTSFATHPRSRGWHNRIDDFITTHLVTTPPVLDRLTQRHCDTPVSWESIAARLKPDYLIDCRQPAPLTSAVAVTDIHYHDELVQRLATLELTDVDVWFCCNGGSTQWDPVSGQALNRYARLEDTIDRTVNYITLSCLAQLIHHEWLLRHHEPHISLHMRITPNDEALFEIYSLDGHSLLKAYYLDLALCYLAPLTVVDSVR